MARGALASRPFPELPRPPVRLPYPLPLDWLHVQRIERLEKLVGARYQGWGREFRGFFVDVFKAGAEPNEQPERFIADTLYEALGQALRVTQEQHP